MSYDQQINMDHNEYVVMAMRVMQHWHRLLGNSSSSWNLYQLSTRHHLSLTSTTGLMVLSCPYSVLP